MKFTLLLASVVVAFPNVAAARCSDATTVEDEGYGYCFDDDPISAAPFNDRGARLRVRSQIRRSLLIRPRTHFVRELLKSAEDS